MMTARYQPFQVRLVAVQSSRLQVALCGQRLFRVHEKVPGYPNIGKMMPVADSLHSDQFAPGTFLCARRAGIGPGSLLGPFFSFSSGIFAPQMALPVFSL